MGANWYPRTNLNFALQYYYQLEQSNYDWSVPANVGTVGTIPSAGKNTGIISAEQLITNDVNARATWRPCSGVSLVTRYDMQYVTMDNSGIGSVAPVGLGETQSAKITNNMGNTGGFQIIGTSVDRLPNITCLTMPGMLSETQVMAFDLENIAVSAGAACSSGTVKSSRILQSMGYSPALAQTAIRVSTGWATQPEDLETFANTWLALYAKQNQRHTKVAS